MSFSRSSSNSGSSIPTSRSSSVALDLMLRTFMNSTEFQSSNPRVWENISKLVPGTTPQQVNFIEIITADNLHVCTLSLQYHSIFALIITCCSAVKDGKNCAPSQATQ